MSAAVTIGIAQITGKPFAPGANRDHSVRAGRELFGRGAHLVVLPELIVPGYAIDGDRLHQLAEPIDGPTVTAWSSLAAEAGGYVVGGFCERSGTAIYNSAVLIGGEGLLLHYRKLHLFDQEKMVFTPGDLGLPVVYLPFGSVGLCVCYDLRFVETARILELRGAELICVPTAWVPGFDSQRWDSDGYCPQARGALLQANLDQVYIACASQAGASGEVDFLGSSVLCDPYGQPLIGPLSGDGEELAVAQIDLDVTTHSRTRGELIAPRGDRRNDVYGVTIGDERL